MHFILAFDKSFDFRFQVSIVCQMCRCCSQTALLNESFFNQIPSSRYRIHLDDGDSTAILTPPTPPPRRFIARTSLKKRLPCIRKQESGEAFVDLGPTRLMVERQPDGPSKALLSQQRRSHVELSTRYPDPNRAANDRRNSLQLQSLDSKSALSRLLSADLTTQPSLLQTTTSPISLTPKDGELSPDKRSPKDASLSPTITSPAGELLPVSVAMAPVSTPSDSKRVSIEPQQSEEAESSDEYGEYDFDQSFKVAEESALREQHALLSRPFTGNTLSANFAEKASKGAKKRSSKRSFRLSRKSKKRNKSVAGESSEANGAPGVSQLQVTPAVSFSGGSGGLLDPSSRTSSATHSQQNSHLDLHEAISPTRPTPTPTPSPSASHLLSLLPDSSASSSGRSLHVKHATVTTCIGGSDAGFTTTTTSGLALDDRPPSTSKSTSSNNGQVIGKKTTTTAAPSSTTFTRPRALSNIAASLRFVPVPAMAVAGFSLPGENLLQTRFYSGATETSADAAAQAGAPVTARRSIGHGLTAAMAAATGALAVGSAAHRASPFRASYHGKSAKQSSVLHAQHPVDRRLLNADNVRTAQAVRSTPLDVVGSAESLVSRVLQEQGLGKAFSFFVFFYFV